MKRLLLSTLAILGIAGLTATAAQAMYGENLEPGTALLCPNPGEIVRGICPAQESLPRVYLRETQSSGRTLNWEVIREMPRAVNAPVSGYYCGWGTGSGSSYKGLGMMGLERFATSCTVPSVVSLGSEYTVWAQLEGEPVEWRWGVPCQTSPSYLQLYPCGHYVGLYFYEGTQMVVKLPAAPLRHAAARVR